MKYILSLLVLLLQPAWGQTAADLRDARRQTRQDSAAATEAARAASAAQAEERRLAEARVAAARAMQQAEARLASTEATARIAAEAAQSAAAERALRAAALWEEVKDRLKNSALGMSGGQQQRLCIARAIVADPEVLLLDEPCSALDPIATLKIEELIHEISERYTVLIVTHNMQQAARVSAYTAFMYLGRLVEYGRTADIFQMPRLRETEDYVTGRFG